MENINEKNFDLGAILNITTGRLFTSINDVNEIVKYLTNKEVSSLELVAMMEYLRPYVLKLHPELEGVGNDVVINSFADAEEFINEQKQIFGNELPLRPIEYSNEVAYSRK